MGQETLEAQTRGYSSHSYEKSGGLDEGGDSGDEEAWAGWMVSGR